MIVIENNKYYTIDEAAEILDTVISTIQKSKAYSDSTIIIGGKRYIPAENMQLFLPKPRSKKK